MGIQVNTHESHGIRPWPQVGQLASRCITNVLQIPICKTRILDLQVYE